MMGLGLCLDDYDKVEVGAVVDAGMIEDVVSESLWETTGDAGRIIKSFRTDEIIVIRTKGFTRSAMEIPHAAEKSIKENRVIHIMHGKHEVT